MFAATIDARNKQQLCKVTRGLATGYGRQYSNSRHAKNERDADKQCHQRSVQRP